MFLAVIIVILVVLFMLPLFMGAGVAVTILTFKKRKELFKKVERDRAELISSKIKGTSLRDDNMFR